MNESLLQVLRNIRSGKLDYATYFDNCLAKIENLDQKVNALTEIDKESKIIGKHFDSVKNQDKYATFPLFGVPILIKDTILTKNLVTRAGSEQINEIGTDAKIITLLKGLGAYILAKTNVPEFSLDVQTYNKLLPATSNPWDLTRTPGGSSGGSAVALSLEYAPIALGTDLNGSLRIPASFTHTCSFKPTDGLLPTTGIIPPLDSNAKRYNLSVGIMAKRAVDLLFVIERLLAKLSNKTNNELDKKQSNIQSNTQGSRQGSEQNGNYKKKTKQVFNHLVSEKQLESVCDEFTPGKLLVFPKLEGIATDLKIVSKIEKSCNTFNSFGFQVNKTTKNPFDAKELTQAQVVLANNFIHSDTSNLKYINSRLIPSQEKLREALKIKYKYKLIVDKLLQNKQCLIFPVTPTLPYKHNFRHKAIKINGLEVPYWKATLPYCTPFSMSGHPVVVIPLTIVQDYLLEFN